MLCMPSMYLYILHRYMLILNFVFVFSITVDKLGDYPVWLVLYIVQNVWPMIGLAAVAIRILLRNGKDMRRQLLGVSIKPINKSSVQSSFQIHIPIFSLAMKLRETWNISNPEMT